MRVAHFSAMAGNGRLGEELDAVHSFRRAYEKNEKERMAFEEWRASLQGSDAQRRYPLLDYASWLLLAAAIAILITSFALWKRRVRRRKKEKEKGRNAALSHACERAAAELNMGRCDAPGGMEIIAESLRGTGAARAADNLVEALRADEGNDQGSQNGELVDEPASAESTQVMSRVEASDVDGCDHHPLGHHHRDLEKVAKEMMNIVGNCQGNPSMDTLLRLEKRRQKERQLMMEEHKQRRKDEKAESERAREVQARAFDSFRCFLFVVCCVFVGNARSLNLSSFSPSSSCAPAFPRSDWIAWMVSDDTISAIDRAFCVSQSFFAFGAILLMLCMQLYSVLHSHAGHATPIAFVLIVMVFGAFFGRQMVPAFGGNSQCFSATFMLGCSFHMSALIFRERFSSRFACQFMPLVSIVLGLSVYIASFPSSLVRLFGHIPARALL